jgi:hypothetical protein
MLDTRTGTRRWQATTRFVANENYPILIGDELWLSSQKGAEVLDVASGRRIRRFGVPHHQTCANNCATPNYFVFLRIFVPVNQQWSTGGFPHFYCNRTIQNQCRDKINPSYGSVYDDQQLCTCEAHLPGASAHYAVPLTPSVEDPQRLQAVRVSPLGPVQSQSAARASTVASDWGKPQNAAEWLFSYQKIHMEWGSGKAPVWCHYEYDQTQPVAAGDLALVAQVHEHRLVASRGGKEVWNVVAGGRVSCPPVVHGKLALFGSHDGYVYAVNLNDGTLAWRFLAAPADKRHVVFGQVESVWPVFNVLVHQGKAYFAAGRHPELEGGIHIYCLDPATGKMHWHVKHLRGLSTETLTPERPASGSGWAARGAGPTNIPNYDASWIIADTIRIGQNKIYMRLFPVVDLADPKDAILNAQTLVPPGISVPRKP